MSSTQYRMLHFLVHSAFLCANLYENGNVDGANFTHDCASHLISDYDALQQLLNVTSDDLCSLLHCTVLAVFRNLNRLHTPPLLSENARLNWEKAFCTRINKYIK